MFVDASAIIAILTAEPEADHLANRLDAAERRLTSSIAIFEATLGLTRKHALGVAEAKSIIQAFLHEAGIHITPITEQHGDVALDAFARYGKGRGHPAQLNLGDCFAYACARSHGVALLYKGMDFDQTDLAAP